MMQMQQLIDAGIDVNDALDRFMNNEAMMLKFLKRFSQDQNMEKLRQAVSAKDVQGAYTAAHTLKGVTGNLSMKRLYTLLSEMVEPLRAGDISRCPQQMPALEAEYARVMAALEALEGERDRG